MSSHSLLSRDLEQDAAKAESEQDATKPEAEEVKPTVTIKQEQIEANTKFTAFKKKLGKRTLQISISDESTTPPGQSSAAPSAKAMAASPKSSPKASDSHQMDVADTDDLEKDLETLIEQEHD